MGRESDGRCVRCGGSRQRRSPYVSGPRTARHRQEPGAGPDRRVGERRGAGAGETSRRLACRLRAVDERYGTTNRHAAHAFHHAIRHHDAGQPFDRSRSVHAGTPSHGGLPGILRLLVEATLRVRKIRKAQQELAAGQGSVCGRPEDGAHRGRRVLHRRDREPAATSAGDDAPGVRGSPRRAHCGRKNIGCGAVAELRLFVVQDYASAPASGHPFITRAAGPSAVDAGRT